MTEDRDYLLLKAILKEMPKHSPWCYDEWGDEEDKTVISCFNTFYFDPEKLESEVVRFAKMFIGNTVTPFGSLMPQPLANLFQDCRDFARVVMARYKSYKMVDNDIHDVLDI